MQLADSTPAAVGVRVVAIMPSDSGNYIAGHTGVISRLNNPFAIVRWDHSAEEHTSKCAKLNTNSMQLADSTPAAVGVRVVAIMPSDSGNYIAGHTGVISRLNNPFAIVRWDHSAEEHTSKCAKLEWEPLQKHGGSDEPVLESGWGMAPELVGQTLSFDRCSVELLRANIASLLNQA